MATVDRVLTSSPTSSVSPPTSRTSTYETSSGSSSSTVPGPGALSGKAIKALGRMTLRGIDHLVIRRQLSVIAHHFPLPDVKAALAKDPDEIYADALEFSRQGLYREEINRRALQLLLRQIGMGETQYLVRALSRWNRLELRLFLSEILIQLAPLWNPWLGKVLSSPLLSAYAEACKSPELPIAPLLLFISKLVRTRGSVGRAVLDVGFLDVLMLIRSLNDLESGVIISEPGSTDGTASHRKRLLILNNAVLLDIVAYPELRSVVLNHPICTTWATAPTTIREIVPFTSRERTLFLDSKQNIPDDDCSLYMSLDLPTVAKLVCVSEVDTEELINSLTFGVEYDQAFRVFLSRSPYGKKVELLSKMILHMLEEGSASSNTARQLDRSRTRYRVLFFLRFIAAAAWSPSNRAALIDAGVIDFLVRTVQTEVPESYADIIASSDHEDRVHIPAIIKEQGLAPLLGGPLAKTSRLVGLIAAAFSALFPGDTDMDMRRKQRRR
ncbi:hypothetical protein MSAN_02421800 [Mycena sanguinolenta]|uniref:Uncharacterized protein n=1 Tax=Mycena sanguinolenta TaxID=230812 RepID=A0A8H6X2L7_9AGAR|nr:hypothetical protein MSAN_02421800 [Mycena sanguinolenta]